MTKEEELLEIIEELNRRIIKLTDDYDRVRTELIFLQNIYYNDLTPIDASSNTPQ